MLLAPLRAADDAEVAVVLLHAAVDDPVAARNYAACRTAEDEPRHHEQPGPDRNAGRVDKGASDKDEEERPDPPHELRIPGVGRPA